MFSLLIPASRTSPGDPLSLPLHRATALWGCSLWYRATGKSIPSQPAAKSFGIRTYEPPRAISLE